MHFKKYAQWCNWLLLLVLVAAGCLEPETRSPEAIALWIEKEPVPVKILKDKVDVKMKTLGVTWEISEEDFARIVDSCINDLVTERVVRQKADSMNLQVAAGFENLGDDSNVYYGEGFEFLEQSDIDWWKRVRSGLELIDLSEQIALKLTGDIVIAEEDIRKEYENRIDFFTTPEILEYQIIKVNDPGQADDIHKQLSRKRSTFEALAKKHSCIRGEGALGEIVRKSAGEFPGNHEMELLKLKEGRISPVLMSGDGYYIYKICRKYPEQVLPLDEVRDRLRQDLIGGRRTEVFQKWLDQEIRKVTIRYGTPLPFNGAEQ